MVDVYRPLTQRDILPSATPKASPQLRRQVFHLPSFASSWEEEKREQDEAWAKRLNQLANNTERILSGVLPSSEPVVAITSVVASVAKELKGASSPTSEDWDEFAAETPEERARIVAGWKNLEAALA